MPAPEHLYAMSTFFEPLEADLLPRVVDGERGAQQRFYQHYVQAAHTLAWRLLGGLASQLAEEVVQDSFMDAFDRIHQLRDPLACGGWFRQVVVNRCLRAMRAPWFRRRRNQGSVALDELSQEGHEAAATRATHGPHANQDPHATQAGSATLSATGLVELQNLLARLPSAGRAVVVLHEIEGYSHPEIAAILGRSVSYSKSQLARSLRALRKELGQRSKVHEPNEGHSPEHNSAIPESPSPNSPAPTARRHWTARCRGVKI